MGYNLVVWAWQEDYDNASKRRKKRVKYGDVMDGFFRNASHPSMKEVDFEEFLNGLKARLTLPDGCVVERYPVAVVFNMGSRDVMEFVPKIGSIAREYGLTSAGE